MTKNQLKRFIRKRNKRAQNSNLQFSIDAAACGFRVEDLGGPEFPEPGHYVWETPYGQLIERDGVLSMGEY